MIKKLFITGALSFAAVSFAQTIVYQENFESPEARNMWTISELDGDTDTWEFLDATINEVDSFTGYFAASFSWYFEAFTPDNTLTSPAILLPTTGPLQLSFKVAAGDEELFDEHYAVYVIPADATFTGTETPVFEETLDGGYLAAAKVVNVDVSAFQGQNVKLVFRHYNCTDIFYIGIDDVEIIQTNLSVSDTKNQRLKIYPNPTSDFVEISNVKDLKIVRIFDLTGKLVLQSANSKIDVRQLPKGQYILNVHAGEQISSQKFIKK